MKKTIKQQRKDMLKKYEGKLSGPYDHLKEGVDYLDDIQRNKGVIWQEKTTHSGSFKR